MRFLIVEDDAVLRNVLTCSLSEAGHRVDAAATCAEAESFWSVQPYDAVVLDLNLPDGSGLTALKNARRRGDATPVLVLTARNRTDERIAGLDAGADDYVGKPFYMSWATVMISIESHMAISISRNIYSDSACAILYANSLLFVHCFRTPIGQKSDPFQLPAYANRRHYTGPPCSDPARFSTGR